MFLSSAEVTDELCNTHVWGVGWVFLNDGQSCAGQRAQDKVATGSFLRLSFSGQTRAVSLKTVGQVSSSVSLAYDSYGCRTGRVAARLLLTARRRPAGAVNPQYLGLSSSHGHPQSLTRQAAEHAGNSGERRGVEAESWHHHCLFVPVDK